MRPITGRFLWTGAEGGDNVSRVMYSPVFSGTQPDAMSG